MSAYAIRNPTRRKVLNRGWIPARYRTDEGAFNGWVVKHGRKYIHFYSISHGRVLPIAGEDQLHLIEEDPK